VALGWLWWRAWFPVDAAVAAAVCMAGVALDDICLDFAWQVWHLATSTSTLRGSRGTYGTGLALVAWTPRSQRLFAWRAWHFATSAFTLCGRRGTWRHRPTLYVAGVTITASGGALGSQWTPRSPRLFAWQAWHLATIDLHFVWQAWHLATWTFTLRGRCGTYGIWWRATYSHTQLHTHTQLIHTQQLVHAQLVHTQLTH